eukprot:361581-Chlamydomonas_euryale.AAC.1
MHTTVDLCCCGFSMNARQSYVCIACHSIPVHVQMCTLYGSVGRSAGFEAKLQYGPQLPAASAHAGCGHTRAHTIARACRLWTRMLATCYAMLRRARMCPCPCGCMCMQPRLCFSGRLSVGSELQLGRPVPRMRPAPECGRHHPSAAGARGARRRCRWASRPCAQRRRVCQHGGRAGEPGPACRHGWRHGRAAPLCRGGADAARCWTTRRRTAGLAQHGADAARFRPRRTATANAVVAALVQTRRKRARQRRRAPASAASAAAKGAVRRRHGGDWRARRARPARAGAGGVGATGESGGRGGASAAGKRGVAGWGADARGHGAWRQGRWYSSGSARSASGCGGVAGGRWRCRRRGAWRGGRPIAAAHSGRVEYSACDGMPGQAAAAGGCGCGWVGVHGWVC